MTLEQLTEGVPGVRYLLPGGVEDPAAREWAARTDVRAVAYRADRVTPGDLFCCLPGVRADGHDFAADALARGASALLVARPLPLPVPQALVGDPRLGMALAAAAREGHPSRRLRMVGVTGTNGKTTSAYLLAAILDAAGLRSGLIGTVEVRVGGAAETPSHTTPESVDLQALLRRMADAGDLACAMEVSSHALAQRRAAGVEFAAALFTNLTRDHLDYHGDEESYFRAKRALFVRPPGEGDDPPAAVNLDDAAGRRIAADRRVLGFAVDAAAEVRPDRLHMDPRGFRAAFRTPRGPLEIESPLRGRFNVSNVAGAVAVGELLGLDHDAVARGIAGLRGVPGRLEPVDAGQGFQVLVDYAHTPDSLENVLLTARDLAGDGRLIVVFGCGGDRDRGKRPQMGAIGRRLADVCVVTSDNPRTEDPDAIIAEILEGAADGPAALVVEADRRAAIHAAVGMARRGDVVLVAGKGHEPGQEVHGVVTPFDDRDVARAALGVPEGR
ncbi:MAG: UDP-N-acetylmuramoyl-L-alanyl-D-glutamate--2,6-diaminopimelate ligase [Thermoleophilia bacterium]|jgi:UDP-N-acetylmuramoyl-L-alanyl-D-glutamate--2,6-diaminopimelate ligase|nr:UDP-N-acetylmuramoyl-L-alanyl-D-glutamate--2,6-diaminopimelate ligase [Thermoleophilia bacterium]